MAYGQDLTPELSRTQQIGRMLSGFGEGYQGRGAQFAATIDAQDQRRRLIGQERKDAMVQDIYQASELAKGGDVQGAMNILGERAELLPQMGGDPTETLAGIELLKAGKVDEFVGDAGEFLTAASRAKDAKGNARYEFLQAPSEQAVADLAYKRAQTEKLNSESGFNLESRKRKAEMDRVSLQLKQLELKEAQDGGSSAADVGKIREEVRAKIDKGTSKIRSQVSDLESNFEKFGSLIGEIRGGNRTAVLPALVAVTKLGDPGSVVSRNEAADAMNAQDPVQAMTSLLAGKGYDADMANSIVAALDPLNPDNINPDALLKTAQAMLSSNVASIQSNWDEYSTRANENLTPEGIKSVLSAGLGSRVKGLSALKFATGGLPEGTTENQDGTFTLPDGRTIRAKK